MRITRAFIRAKYIEVDGRDRGGGGGAPRTGVGDRGIARRTPRCRKQHGPLAFLSRTARFASRPSAIQGRIRVQMNTASKALGVQLTCCNLRHAEVGVALSFFADDRFRGERDANRRRRVERVVPLGGQGLHAHRRKAPVCHEVSGQLSTTLWRVQRSRWSRNTLQNSL